MADMNKNSDVLVKGLGGEVGTYAQNSGRGNMKRNPRVCQTNVRVSKLPGSQTKGFGPSVTAPLGDNYKSK